MAGLVQHLRCNVVGRPAQGLLLLALKVDFGREAKVANLQVDGVVQEQVAQLQVAVDDVPVVQVFTARDQLNAKDIASVS